jgi:hypothetical protein
MYTTQRHPCLDSDPSDFFATRAQTLLQYEIDCPSLATVQALVVLCAYEAAQGLDSRGTQ